MENEPVENKLVNKTITLLKMPKHEQIFCKTHHLFLLLLQEEEKM